VAGDTAKSSASSRAHMGWVLVAAVGLFLLKLLLGFEFSAPWYEPDESSYALRGYHLAHGDGLSWRHRQRAPGMEGYPALLSAPWFLAGDNADLFLRLAGALNAVLASATLLLAYAVLRHWFPHWPAFAGAAATVLYAPVFCYGLALLSENLFFPAVLLALWAVQKAAATHRAWWWALTGVAVAVCFAARITGIVAMIALVLVVLVEMARHLIRWRQRSWQAGVPLAALLACAVVTGSLYLLSQPKPEKLIEVGTPVRETTAPPPASASAPVPAPGRTAGPPSAAQAPEPKPAPQALGYLSSGALRQIRWHSAEYQAAFVRSVLWEMDYLILAGFALLPVLAGAFAVVGCRRRDAGGRRQLDLAILFAILICLGTFGLTCLQLARGTEVGMESMYGRYIDVVAMLLAGVGVAFACAGGVVVGPNAVAAGPGRPGASHAGAISLGRHWLPWTVILCLALLFAAVAGHTLPQAEMMLSGNFGAIYAAYVSSVLAAKAGYAVGEGASLNAVILALLVIAIWIAWRRWPKTAGLLLLACLVANTAYVHRCLAEFRARHEPFLSFGRASVPVLEAHFRRYPKAPRVVLIDHLDANAGEATKLARFFGLCKLELCNPGIQFRPIPDRVVVGPEVVLFTLRPKPYRLLLQSDNRLRLYQCAAPDISLAQPAVSETSDVRSGEQGHPPSAWP